MSFDLIDQRSCNHVSYKGPCKCVLDINIIIYTQTYVRVCMQLHAYVYMHVVPVDEPGTTLYICTNNIIHARTMFAKVGQSTSTCGSSIAVHTTSSGNS